MKNQTSANEGGDQNLKRGRTPTPENNADEGDDWNELVREERMAKKVRKGNITLETFDEQFADL